MGNYNKNYFQAFNQLEIWAIILFVVLVIVSLKTSLLIIPTLVMMPPPVYFLLILVFAFVVAIFTKDGSKTKLLFSLVETALTSVVSINYQGVSIDNLDDVIILCNYPSNFVEYLFIPMLLDKYSKKSAILISNMGYNYAKLFIDPVNLIQLNKKNNYETLPEVIAASLDNKIIPIIFPENKFWQRRHVNEIQPFRSGIFDIAKKLNKKIAIATIEHVDHFCGMVLSKTLTFKIDMCVDHDPITACEQMQKMLR